MVKFLVMNPPAALKNYLLSLVMLLLPVATHAQWYPHGDTVYDDTYNCFGYKIHFYYQPNATRSMVTIRDSQDKIFYRYYPVGGPILSKCRTGILGFKQPGFIVLAGMGVSCVSFTTSFFVVDDGLKRIMDTHVSHVDYGDIYTDLDGDGIEEIIQRDETGIMLPNSLIEGKGNAALYRILCYEKDRYQDCSRRFTDRLEPIIAEESRWLRKWDPNSEAFGLPSSAATIVTERMIQGREEEGWAFVKSHLTKKLYLRLRARAAYLRQIATDGESRLTWK